MQVSNMTNADLLVLITSPTVSDVRYAEAYAELLRRLDTGERWQPIKTAPKDATEVRVLMRDGTMHEKAHWASDLSGEDQPAFQGWFIPSPDTSGFREIEEPTHWRPLPAPSSEAVQGQKGKLIE